MDEKVRAIQERLRQQFGASMVPGQRFDGVPLVAFDEVAGLPTGGEAFVDNLLAELKRMAGGPRSAAAGGGRRCPGGQRARY